MEWTPPCWPPPWRAHDLFESLDVSLRVKASLPRTASYFADLTFLATFRASNVPLLATASTCIAGQF
jgi:hypothetical protein